MVNLVNASNFVVQNLPLTTALTNFKDSLTTLTKITTLTTLTNDVKLLLYITFQPKSISQLSKTLGKSSQSVAQTLSRPHRNTGLIYDGLAEKIQIDGVTHYQATEKGVRLKPISTKNLTVSLFFFI